MLKVFFVLAAIVIMSIVFLYIGGYGLFKKKVMPVSSKKLTLVIAMGFLPSFADSFTLITKLPAIAFINIGMFFGLVGLFWFILKGLILFGSTEENFKAGMDSVFQNLNLEYEWGLGSLKLGNGATFSYALQDWIGSAQLKPKNAEAKKLMPSIIREAKKYYLNSNHSIKNLIYILYFSLGVILLIVGLLLIGYFTG